MRKFFKTAVATLILACSLHVMAQASDRGYWQASSNSAKTITGDISISETKVTINFLNFTIAPARVLKPEEVSALFDADINTAGNGQLYKLGIPAAQRFQHKNTLCGEEKTQWMVTWVSTRQLHIAFFSGDAAPVLTFDAVSHSQDLCGNYTYAR
jgi:hypothetical protein